MIEQNVSNRSNLLLKQGLTTYTILPTIVNSIWTVYSFRALNTERWFVIHFVTTWFVTNIFRSTRGTTSNPSRNWVLRKETDVWGRGVAALSSVDLSTRLWCTDVLLQRIQRLINVTDPRAGTGGAMIGGKKPAHYLKMKFFRSEKSEHWVIVGPYVLEEIKQCLASGWMRVLPVISLGICLRRAEVRIA
jgi:hypothetical protein